MGKVKQANGKAAKAAKPVSAVKNASITKATDSPKAKSKKVAKEVASKAATNGKEKSSKKSKKVETESESDSDASDDSDSDSASDAEDSDSDDSDSSSESESDKKTKKAAPKTNGTAAKPAAAKPAAVNGKAKGKAATPESSDSSDSSDAEDDDSDDSDDSEDDAATKAKPAVVAKEKVKAKAEVSFPSCHPPSSRDEANPNYRNLTLTLMTLMIPKRTLTILMTLTPRTLRSPRQRPSLLRSARPTRRSLRLSRRTRPRHRRTSSLPSSLVTLAGALTTTCSTRPSRSAPVSTTPGLLLTRLCNGRVASAMSTSTPKRMPRPLWTR